MRFEASPREQGALDLPLVFAGVLLLAGGLGAAWLALGLPVPGCPLREATGIPCLTCGGARMAASLLRGDVVGAALWNPLLFLSGAGVLVAGAVNGVRRILGAPRIRPVLSAREKRLVRITGIALLVLGWFYLLAAGI